MIIGIVLGIIVIGLLFYYHYLRRWARFFVDAIVERDNHWYLSKGQPSLNPDAKKEEPTDDLYNFWLTEYEWGALSFDQEKLVASTFLQDSSRWVICVHGYRSTGFDEMSAQAKTYFEAGYNVLVPDLRAHGRSSGKIIGLGWLDRLDLITWINLITENNPQAEIILHGEGMGAAAVLMASGEKLPPQVKLLIADSSYTSVYSAFKYQLHRLTNYPVNRFMGLANQYAKKRNGYSLLEASVSRQLGSNHLPVLFLHGQEDQFIPVKETVTLMEATADKKELKIFAGVGHLKAKKEQPEAYWQTIWSFIEKNLG